MFGRLKLEMDRLQLSANYYISTFSQQLYIMLFEDFFTIEVKYVISKLSRHDECFLNFMKLKIYKNNIIYTYTEPQLQYNAILI